MTGREKIILLCILLLAVFLRLYKLEERLTFDWDQENFAWQAKQIIVDHKPTLIGAEQSIGGIHLGPFYTYVLSFFYLIFRMDPVAGGVSAIFFGVLSILALYLVGSKLFSNRVGFIGSTIYALSFLMIKWDLVSWNVNPLYPLSLLSLYSLYKSLTEEKYLIILGLLLGLGFHVHLTMILFSLLSLVVYLYQRPKFRQKTVILSFLIFLFALSPLIIFEIRHNFQNLRQSFGILSLTQNTAPQGKFKLIVMVDMIKNELFSFATFFLPNYLKPIIQLFFLFIFLSARFFTKKSRKFIDIGLLLVFLVFLTFSIYPGHVTEYYLSILIPLGILLGSFMIDYLFKQNNLFKTLVFALTVIFVVFNLNSWYNDDKVMSLKNKKDAIQYIINQNDNKPFRFSSTSLPGYGSGYKYLLWFYQAKITENLTGPVYTIVTPSGAYGIKPLKEFHGVGIVWNQSSSQ